MQNLVMPIRPSFPIEQQTQGWWPEPQSFPEQKPQPVQEPKPQQESANVPPQQNQPPMQLPEHFGQNFPQPQFPVYIIYDNL